MLTSSCRPPFCCVRLSLCLQQKQTRRAPLPSSRLRVAELQCRPLCAQWPPPQGLSPEHPVYGCDPKEPPELGILHPSISVCHGSFTTHSFVLCCSVWGLPFEEVSSCTPRPTRCLAHGDAHGGPACWGPGRGPPPPCPAPGSRHSARRAASLGGGPWCPVPQVGRLAPREAHLGFAPRPGSPLCIRQPLALERQSRMPDACLPPRPQHLGRGEMLPSCGGRGLGGWPGSRRVGICPIMPLG